MRERRTREVFGHQPGSAWREQEELIVDYLFLLSNASVAVTGAVMRERYRKRGAAEKDCGDWTGTKHGRPRAVFSGSSSSPQRPLVGSR